MTEYDARPPAEAGPPAVTEVPDPAPEPGPIDPAAPTPDARPATVHPPRSPRRLARITVALLTIAAIVWGGGILLVDLAAYDLLAAAEAGTMRFGDEELFLERAETFGRLSLVLEFGIAVSLLAWLHRTVAGVPLLGGGQTLRSPRGAIGWWFVPIANFFVPYRIVADADRRLAVISGVPWSRWLVLGWWLAWVGGGLLGRVVLLTREADLATFQQVRELLEIGLYADLGIMIAAILLARLVWRMQARQDARIRAMVVEQAVTPVAIPA